MQLKLCGVYQEGLGITNIWHYAETRHTFHASVGRQWPPAYWPRSSWADPGAAAAARFPAEPAAPLAAD